MVIALMLGMVVMRHHHNRVMEDQSAQAAVPEDVASNQSTVDTPSNTRRPVVHGLPTSTDAGNLAMQWIEWSTAERNVGYRFGPVSEIERRLPYMQQVRQKLADMSLQDDCAKSAQRAELASMDADIKYFQMQVDIAHTPIGANPDLVRQGEERAADDAYALGENAYQMAKNCTTP
ncbi:hypothetical protein [Dyella choica]|uniref:Uncharacterized protein n=1 Tax=Dyella choica TaxID=1927959 RepID=A0A3S0RKQ7_9GAMM|nr:hypothetical protein [Dyella choica]RUL75969.1 hypothetical protein EKH80_09605 [Dyella choica]